MSEQFSLELPKSNTITCHTNVKYAQVSYDEFGSNLLFRTDSNTTIPQWNDVQEFDAPLVEYERRENLNEYGFWRYWHVSDNGKYVYLPLWVEISQYEIHNQLMESEKRWIELLKENFTDKESFERISGQKLSLHTEIRDLRYKLDLVM